MELSVTNKFQLSLTKQLNENGTFKRFLQLLASEQSVSVCRKRTAVKLTSIALMSIKSQHKVSIIHQFEMEIQLCIEMEQV